MRNIRQRLTELEQAAELRSTVPSLTDEERVNRLAELIDHGQIVRDANGYRAAVHDPGIQQIAAILERARLRMIAAGR